MLGLQPPRIQTSLDDVLDIAEDVMKKFMFEFRKAAIKELDDITKTEKTSVREQIRNIAKVRFQEFALVIKEPLTQVIKTIREDTAKIEPKRPLDVNKILYPLHGPRSQQDRIQSAPNINRDVKIAQTNERGLIINELKFHKLQEFINYPQDVRQVQRLSVDLDSQGIGDNGLPHFGRILGMYYGCRSLMLNLSTNSITQKGAELLGQGMFELKNLINLNLNLYNNKVKQKGMNLIIQPIANNCACLRELRVELACNQIGSGGMADLGVHLLNIRSLDKLWLGLYDNQIYDDGMKNYLNSFAKCQAYTTFTIDLRLNPIQKNLIEKLKTYIKHKKINNFELQF
ncbi:hypothetical protein ABPG72_000351 [Tetrahymena utriculariae]